MFRAIVKQMVVNLLSEKIPEKSLQQFKLCKFLPVKNPQGGAFCSIVCRIKVCLARIVVSLKMFNFCKIF